MGISWEDKPKLPPFSSRRKTPQATLYIMEMIGRAVDQANHVRKYAARPGRHDGRTKYTIAKLQRDTGLCRETVIAYLTKKRKIAPEKLDQIMVAMNFDILDLIKPSELVEMWRRRGTQFHHEVKKYAERTEMTEDEKKKLDEQAESE